jgi:crossover junction endodeoxyribonuclease RusA
LLKIELSLPPSVNRLWRTTKAGGMHRSAQYTTWRAIALWQVAVQIKGKGIVGKYKATFHFVRPDKRRRDLDNLLKAAMDVMVTAKAVESDHLCEWLIARWVEDGPECVIMLEALDESSN